MLYIALATDYDGTLAHDGQVSEETFDALKRFRDRGKTLIMVTGRELPDLQRVFPEVGLFDAIVAENGALLFLPKEGEQVPLGPEPPAEFVESLRAKNVAPLSIGHSIVATWSPNEDVVLETVHELGLEWQIIFNKGAVMCLPPGINKASGLTAALDHLKLSPLNVVGVGDAENDHAFLSVCGFSVAVANALDAVKREADFVTKAHRGAGVVELIHRMDEEHFGAVVKRHGIQLGQSGNSMIPLFPGRDSILIAGASGAGKSKLSTALMENIVSSDAQLIAIDPEGDYGTLEGVSHLGTTQRAPSVEEAVTLLDRPEVSLVLGLLEVELPDRPAFLSNLLSALFEMRAHYGRPHWLLIDEAHHFMPADVSPSAVALPAALPGSIFITADPRALSPCVLQTVNTVVASGATAKDVIKNICGALDLAMPQLPPLPDNQQAWFWKLDRSEAELIEVSEPRSEHQRHVRKYAEGTLGEDKSFFFRGPQDKLNLRAYNLTMFVDLADGVDDDTWLHHLRQQDYSRWIKAAIGDDELAEEIAGLERHSDPDADETRSLIRSAIQRRYTAPID